MAGGMIPGAAAGSNHVGASGTWTPQVIGPSDAAAGTPAIPTSNRVSATRSRGREDLMRFLLGARGRGRDDGFLAATRRPTIIMERRHGECRNPRLLPEARQNDAGERHDSLSWRRQLVGALGSTTLAEAWGSIACPRAAALSSAARP